MTRWMFQLSAAVFCAWAALGQSGCGSRTTAIPGGAEEDASGSTRGTDHGTGDKGKHAKRRGPKSTSADEDRPAPEFAYPSDEAGKMLAELLPPHRLEGSSSTGLRTAPQPFWKKFAATGTSC